MVGGRKILLLISQLSFLFNTLNSLCLLSPKTGYRHNFVPPIRTNGLSFVNSSYTVPKYLKFTSPADLTGCNATKDDETPTHSGSLSLVPLDKYKVSKRGTFANFLQRPSRLASRVKELVKDFKESDTYKSVSLKFEKAKERLSSLSMLEQAVLLVLANGVFSFVLPKYSFVFPFQLFPVDSGLGVDVGLDTLLSFACLYYFLKDFKFPDKYFKMPKTSLFKLSMVVGSLVGSFLLSGLFSNLVNYLVLVVSALDYPVSVGMLNSISIMSGHIFWITIGSLILHYTMFPLFGKENPWYKLDLSKTWVYQVLGGYFSSCAVYKLADLAYMLLAKKFDFGAGECTTDQTITNVCDSYEAIPIMLTSIGPCLTAPWWEEMLYRVFTPKLLNTFLPTLVSSVVSSLLFSLNHLSAQSFLQLFALGLYWSMIENKVENIFVTFLIHSLWNSRIFLGSLTGF